MKRHILGVSSLLVAFGFLVMPTLALADTVTVNFDSYTLGSISGQDGWSNAVNPSYDQEVVSSASSTLGYDYSATFGTKSFRISDAVTSDSFGDWVFAKPLTDSVGESAATAGAFSVGARQNHFEVSFDIAATQLTQQPGLHVSVSPDRGDGSRMSYLRMEDGVNGIDVFFDDVQGTGNPANFVETKVASGLSRSVPHHVTLTLDAIDGPSNDVVKVWIDNNLVHIGTSWENYYRYDTEASAEQSPRIVKTVIIQARGTATPADSGKGFLFDNLSLMSGPSAALPVPTTIVVHPGDLDTNGPSPATVATDGLNKWFFYNDENDTVDNTLGSFVTGPGTPPLGTGSAQISVTGTQRRNLATYQFGGKKLGDITTLKFSTYNPSAGNGGGVTRSAYLNFNADFTGNSTAWQRRLVFVPSQNGTVTQNNWKEWDAIQGGNAKYAYSGATWPTTTTGPDAGLTAIPGTTLRTWNDLLADYPGIRVLVGDSWLGLRVGEPYADGYTENLDKFVLGTAANTTQWDFDPAPAAMYKVHILKYLDGATSTAITAGNYQFPMTATWNASNIGAGTGSYTLGTNFGGASDLYGADTSAMTGPYDYTTSEVTDGTSQVVASAAQCAPGKYYLQGYSVSYTGFAGAASASVSATPIALSQNSSDAYIIVWNKKCVATGEIRGSKFEDWDGDSSPFETKWEDGLSGWTIYLDTNNNGVLDIGEPSTTTNSKGAYRFIGLTAGTYHVREVQQNGWVSTYPSTNAANEKYDINLAAGQIAKKKDFGNFKLGSISGMKFEDKNGNKKKDANETGLPGWTIILKGPGDTSISTTTDAQGKYSFTGLKAGIYKLSEVKQTGWIQTVSPHNIKITSDKNSINNNFGNRQKPNNDNGHHDNDED